MEILANLPSDRDYHKRYSGKLCLGLNDAYLYTQSGHYLLYGSELLWTIVHQLPQKQIGMNPRELLKMIGTPTVITCEIGLKRLSQARIRELVGYCVSRLLECRMNGEEISVKDDYAIEIEGDIHHSQIINFEHPDSSEIRDPLIYNGTLRVKRR